MATIKQVLITGLLGMAGGALLVLLTAEGAQAQSPFYPQYQTAVPRTLPSLVVNPKNFKVGAMGLRMMGPQRYAGQMAGPHILTMRPWQPKYPYARPLYGPNLP